MRGSSLSKSNWRPGIWLFAWLFILIFAEAGRAQPQSSARLPHAQPELVGLDSAHLDRIGELALQGIQEQKMPGCVICIGRHGKIAYLQAFGNKRIEPQQQPMTSNTVFDLASLTKPVATASCIMKLVDDGRLRLGAKVVDYFPDFSSHGKDAITIQDLLVHQSGLIPDNPLIDYQAGPEVAWQRICQLKPVAEIGSVFKYSDVNFIVLGKIVELLSGQTLDEFSQQQIFQPLGMHETGFLPDEALRARAAPTEQREGHWMQGEVHDPRAFALGGVAGHAGLFSSAEDLAIFAQMLLSEGRGMSASGEPGQVLSANAVACMRRGVPVSSGLRGLGWDMRTGYSSNRGDLLSDKAFGHGGFTGTVLWIDPELDLFFIFLSNRLHPNGTGSVNHLAGQMANVIASAVKTRGPSSSVHPTSVLCGIDVLQRDGFRQLAGRRIGLITNHTGRNAEGRSTVELLQQANAVELVALFSPEHGFEGKLDIAKIDDAADAKSGLKIYSLYGSTRRPTEEMLAEIDTLVFDIQDIGTRFYTYVSTMGECMLAAAEFGKPFVVLDRPNPINGVDLAGPMLDAGSQSFVGFHPLPVRHGMTTGELAKMIASDLQLDVQLQVIGCEGWNRTDFWDATQLTWVNPSPNMRSLTQALLYPGVGLLETTNVSVGRGTDTPFEVIGAPWIDGRQLSAGLAAMGLPGVVFVPIEFTPESSKYSGEACSGVNIVIVNRSEFEPLRTGLALACQLRILYPQDWETEQWNRLLGCQAVFEAVVAGESLDSVLLKAAEGVSDFKRRRAAHLLY